MVSYASYKTIVLNKMEDYKINLATHEFHFGSDSTFSQIDGFQVAAAVTNYDGVSEDIEDTSIGVVKFYLKQWGLNGQVGVSFIEILTRPCQREDFNFGEENSQSKFYPTNPVSERDLDHYG